MTTLFRTREGDVARLRRALQCGDQLEIDRAAGPLVDRLYVNLLDFCNRLIAGARRPLGVDGVDLAQEAWLRLLYQLAGPAGAQIVDLAHLERLLYRNARYRFLDRLDWQARHPSLALDAPLPEREADRGRTLGDCLAQPTTTERLLFLDDGGRLLPVVEAVFVGDEALRAVCCRPIRRRARQYRAMILFCLGEYYRTDVREACSDIRQLFHRYVALLGIASEDWAAVEAVATEESGDAGLLAAVNAVCGTDLRSRATVSVLRYELRRLAG